MVYNRCVGTRYCSNNCPYKVRRFNFLLFAGLRDTEQFKLMRNPEVTVRSRGVMEKCTYCVQRINAGRDITAEKEDRPIRDGEVITACQPACPAQRHRLRRYQRPEQPGVQAQGADQRNYGMLAELNTRPRTTYLAARAGTRTPSSSRRSAVSMACRDRNEKPHAADDRGRTSRRASAGPHVRHASPTRSADACLTRPDGWAGWSGSAIAFAPGHAAAVCGRRSCSSAASASGASTSPVAWGFAIVNFVWWIGIGHAGTLISAILLLLQAEVATSINRFAEAMTLFAVACAGMFPLLHMGRPWLLLLAVPVSRTPWAVAAVPQPAGVGRVRGLDLCYRVAAVLVRRPDPRPGDHARSAQARRWRQIIYGMLAMGWRGSARHWQRYEAAYLLLAGLATPLVVSVHTVVSFDFAVAHRSRLALDDLPALLRRRRDLLGLRHGADAGHPDPQASTTWKT